MKTAIILQADSPLYNQLAANINDSLNDRPDLFTHIELWLFAHPDHQPILPSFHSILDRVEYFKVEIPEVVEAVLGSLQLLYDKNRPELILFGGDSLGRDLATRLGFRVSGSSCLQVDGLMEGADGLLVQKKVYGNHLTATLELLCAPYCIGLAKKAAAGNETGGEQKLSAPVQEDARFSVELPWLLDIETTSDDTLESGLEGADFIIAVGSGVGSRETVQRIEKIGASLGAEIGASRPVVMNGWMPMNRLLGISGKVAAPRICISAGVSGSGAFMYGIEGSGCIVAINSDKSALIYNYADIGVECDLLEFFSELEKVVEREEL